MKPAPFTYHRPGSLEEALVILSQVAEEDGRIIAGGQSLVPMMALRLAQPAHLVDINGIPSLQGIEVEQQSLVIRALARHDHFEKPAACGSLGPLLATVAQHIAHYPIRQRGTFCGSLAHADPASEWCLTAVTLGGTVIAQRRDGSREIPAGTFIEGPMTTALEADEMISAVRLPVPDPASRFGFYEFNRRTGDFALAMCQVIFTLEDDRMTGVRLGLGGAEDTPRRLTEVENALTDNRLTQETILAASELAASVITPLEDAQTPEDYRRQLVSTVVKRALEAARHPGESLYRNAPSRSRSNSAGRGQTSSLSPFPLDQSDSAIRNDEEKTNLTSGAGSIAVRLNVNSRDYQFNVEARQTLADVIREECGLTGTRVGCEHGVCGSCTIIVDGAPVRACLMFAVQAEGKEIRTIEGLADGGSLHPIQRAFSENHALQCGFCTPGFIMLVAACLEQNPAPTDEEIRDMLSANLCRCTGYQNIINAVKQIVGRLPT